jgi:hypothetical protein
MTRGDVKWRFMNRPVKPLAFFISMTLFTIYWFNVVLDADLANGAIVGDVVGSFALVGFVALIGGWLSRSQVMAEVGLVIAVFVWVTRSMMILFIVGPEQIGFWLSIAWAGTIAGAYVLESMDANGRGHLGVE